LSIAISNLNDTIGDTKGSEQSLACLLNFRRQFTKSAKALPDLPRSTSEFEAGDLSWSALREITRVASSESENEWLEFGKLRPFMSLKAVARACLYCHSALHSGLIRIECDSEGKIHWIPRGEELDLKVKAELKAEEAEVTSIPVVIAGGAAPGLHSVKSESELGKAVGPDPEILARGLMTLGYTKREARERIERAFERLRQLGEPLTEEEILRRACAG
jgi:hypothetical protein